jgi:hypothetical protein
MISLCRNREPIIIIIIIIITTSVSEGDRREDTRVKNREPSIVTKQNKTHKKSCLEAQTLFVFLVNFASYGKAHE